MKVIIIDDEKAMHLILRRLLSKIPGIELAGCFVDTDSACAFLDKQPVNLAFVDINMPRESGMQFAQRMAELRGDLHIAFVTSNTEFAKDAFDVFALDYIIKPVSLERLEKTVSKSLALSQFAQTSVMKPESNRMSIYCLGELHIQTEQTGSVKWASRKSAELFSYLLLHRGRMVSRVRLTSELFSGMPQKNADIYLNTTMYQLRKSLEPHGLKAHITSTNDSYSLETGDAFIDYVDFENRLQLFSVIDASNVEAATAAAELFTGDLFGERAYLWAVGDTERLSAKYAEFVKKLAAALMLRTEGLSQALGLLNKLLARNALDEQVVGLLLEVYALKRDKEAMIKQYGQYMKLLRKEQQLQPSRSLAEWYARSLSKVDNGAE